MANVLLIEDYQSLQKIYSKMLEDAGHSVLVASNGNDGLRLAKDNKIDLILLDIMMPEAGGFEFLEAYDLKKHSSVKLIVLTNMSGVDFVNKAMELGANNYIVKADVTPEKLTKIINDTLN